MVPSSLVTPALGEESPSWGFQPEVLPGLENVDPLKSYIQAHPSVVWSFFLPSQHPFRASVCVF